ncbi:MAG TPA: glyoxalase, partial [Bacteroidia bacterium]|nr:glyoxalase [Bacteroidia bacterium]
MIHFKRLDHIQICIPKGKENEARQFYTDIIGLTEIPKPEALIANGGLWYQLADI